MQIWSEQGSEYICQDQLLQLPATTQLFLLTSSLLLVFNTQVMREKCSTSYGVLEICVIL